MAFKNSIFIKYIIILLSILIITGLGLAFSKIILKKNTEKINTIYKSWIIIFPIVFGCIFCGRVTTIVGICILSIFAFKEFARATGLYRDWWITGYTYLGIISLGIITLVTDPRLNRPGWYGLYMVFPIYFICLLLLVPILKNQSKGQLQKLSLSIMGFIYIGWMFGHLGFLTNSNNAYGYILYIIIAVALNDIAAFTFGKLFGKYKFRSNISPNKTIEGSIGAFVFSLILPWVLHFSFPHFGLLQLILTGIIIGVGGQLGDLTISFIKRDIGIKDMGTLIPGHGGILDRIDSLIFVAPLFFHMIRWFYDIS